MPPSPTPPTGALLTDLYSLNMAASYLRRGMPEPATFELSIRRLPPRRGFLVAAGVEDCLDLLEGFGFDGESLAYLRTLGFEERDLAAFAAMRFTGDVRAIPEGRIALAGEPLLEVTAPIAEAQLVEAYLLNQVTVQTTLATKAARCRIAAAGRIALVDFGFRRSQGIEAGVAAARLSSMVGFAATSNVEAARRFGLRAVGTMAHSYIEAFPSEVEAFEAFARDFPERPIFLVDTYDTRGGVAHAIDVIRRLDLGERGGVRLDSGDVGELAREVRAVLDAAGLPSVGITVSGGLDEHDLARFVTSGSPVDVAGIGTRLVVSADAPYLDSVYKLVDHGGRPVVKLSPDKETLPGSKQVFRSPGLGDILGLAAEPVPGGAEPLLETVMRGGRRLRQRPPLDRSQATFDADLASLPEPAARLTDPVAPALRLSDELRRLTDLARAARP